MLEEACANTLFDPAVITTRVNDVYTTRHGEFLTPAAAAAASWRRDLTASSSWRSLV
jgi:hypothetical protein